MRVSSCAANRLSVFGFTCKQHNFAKEAAYRSIIKRPEIYFRVGQLAPALRQLDQCQQGIDEDEEGRRDARSGGGLSSLTTMRRPASSEKDTTLRLAHKGRCR